MMFKSNLIIIKTPLSAKLMQSLITSIAFDARRGRTVEILRKGWEPSNGDALEDSLTSSGVIKKEMMTLTTE